MPDFETIAHQVGTEQRHAAARDAANALVRAAGAAVLDPGHDITRMDVVLAFGQDDVSEELVRAAGCGHMEHVLGGAVMLISELALRLAAAQRVLPAGETIWVLRTHCGCPMGATIRPLSEAQAWVELAGDAWQGFKAQGYSLAREPKGQAVEDVRANLGRCSHQDRPKPVPCWRCGDQPEDHAAGGRCDGCAGCKGYVEGDPATAPSLSEADHG